MEGLVSLMEGDKKRQINVQNDQTHWQDIPPWNTTKEGP